MRIFAGVLWRGGVKRQWGNRKRRFSGYLDGTEARASPQTPLEELTALPHVFGMLGNEAYIIMYKYLIPCRLSSDPKICYLE